MPRSVQVAGTRYRTFKKTCLVSAACGRSQNLLVSTEHAFLSLRGRLRCQYGAPESRRKLSRRRASPGEKGGSFEESRRRWAWARFACKSPALGPIMAPSRRSIHFRTHGQQPRRLPRHSEPRCREALADPLPEQTFDSRLLKHEKWSGRCDDGGLLPHLRQSARRRTRQAGLLKERHGPIAVGVEKDDALASAGISASFRTPFHKGEERQHQSGKKRNVTSAGDTSVPVARYDGTVLVTRDLW